MQERLEAAEARLTRARADLAQGQRDVEEQEEQLRRMVVSSYQQGDPDLLGLSMVFTTQDPAQLTGRMNANSTVANVEAAVLDQVEAARVLFAVREEETEKAQAEVAARREEAAANLAEKARLEEAARAAAVEVGELVSARRSARATAVEAKRADLRDIARLEAERGRIERLILARAAATRTGPRPGAPGAATATSTSRSAATSPAPSGGAPTRSGATGRSTTGSTTALRCGTPIRAAASGRVLSTYFQTAYGNRIIIDHGVHRGVGRGHDLQPPQLVRRLGRRARGAR